MLAYAQHIHMHMCGCLCVCVHVILAIYPFMSRFCHEFYSADLFPNADLFECLELSALVVVIFVVGVATQAIAFDASVLFSISQVYFDFLIWLTGDCLGIEWVNGYMALKRPTGIAIAVYRLPFFQIFLSFSACSWVKHIHCSMCVLLCVYVLLLHIHPFPLHNYCRDYATNWVIYGTDLGGKLFNWLKFIDGIMNAEIFSNGFLKRDESKK